MADEAVAPGELLRALAAEAWRLEEEALYNHAGHNEAARAADSLYRWLGVPATLIAAAAGVTSFSSAAAGSVQVWPGVVAGALSFGVAALSGLTTFLDPKAHAAEHYQAANAYATLRTEARYLRQVELKKGKPPEQIDAALVALRDRLAKLDEHTPIISARAMTVAARKIKAGDYTYAVDAHTACGRPDCPQRVAAAEGIVVPRLPADAAGAPVPPSDS
jgi:hypothetical protein